MIMAKREIVSALVLLLFSALYVWAIQYIPDRTIPNTPGPSFFPYVIVSLVALLSVSLLIKGLRGLQNTEGAAAVSVGSRLTALTLFSFVIFLLLLEPLGFLTAAIPFFAILMLLFGSRSVLSIVVWSIVIPVTLYLIFTEAFQILLPAGPFGF